MWLEMGFCGCIHRSLLLVEGNFIIINEKQLDITYEDISFQPNKA
jgi:hypothetical protein